MGDWSPLEDDILLKGLLTVLVRRANGKPCSGQRVVLRSCGYVWGSTSAITDHDGIVSVETALGKVEISVGSVTEEAWIGNDLETMVEIII